MGRIKKRVRERRAKNLDELKLFTIEELNKIPKSFIQKLFKNFIKRCKKLIELNGGSFESVRLKQIRKEVIDDEEKEVKEEKKILKVVNRKFKIKNDFNKNELLQKAKKEIALIRKNSKKKKRN